MKQATADDTPFVTRVWQLLLLFNCGGLAGQLSWFSSYPLDVVNNIIKCDTREVAPRIRDVVRENYRREGFMFFYRGLAPCLLRAHLTNGLVLPLFDWTYNKLDPQIED